MRGQRKVDPKLAARDQLEAFIPRFQAYLAGEAETIALPGKPELTIPQLCTFLDALILQMPKKLRKGRFEQILIASRSATELCFAAHVSSTEKLELLQMMVERGHISQFIFDGWTKTIKESAEQRHRETVRIIVDFYKRAFHPDNADRPKHRPRGSESRVTAKFDEAVIQVTLMSVRKERETSNGPMVGYTLPEAEAELRNQVRIALEQEPSLELGDGSPKSNLDAHHKRILRKLRAMHRAADEN